MPASCTYGERSIVAPIQPRKAMMNTAPKMLALAMVLAAGWKIWAMSRAAAAADVRDDVRVQIGSAYAMRRAEPLERANPTRVECVPRRRKLAPGLCRRARASI